ncbi:NAD(P)/FAD-dependent oxidoreductase [Pseudonocardia oroxyli]|uniref:NADH dehydrogenase n=1 Tax=Pseudonocardia oroxyli TaxID=366584 RepID=A0A1G7PVI1_PSEOR|nr:FAD-dependent oxidoreductase [Pseudonocardia oroxyli]SDF89380.1 NADH dehydrogenase [Pseudonocardia oroxyli]
MSAQQQVIVLGGGYAGTLAANRLAPHAAVTVVNPRPEFVQRIRLHQLVAGTHDATVDLGRMLADGVRLVVDEAVRIDAAARRVELVGQTLDYDHLVYAVGSGVTVPEHAYSVAELEDAQKLRVALGAGPVTIVGGGLTGVETAAELAEQGHPVTLVGALAPSLSENGRGRVAARLRGLGVTLLVGHVDDVRPGEVVVDGVPRPSAVTIWTAGFGVPQLAARSGLRTDEPGRLLTDETLTSLDDDRIVAAGDSAAPSGRPLRMSCQAALPLAQHAADTVLARIAGTEPGVIDPAFVGQCVSLGRHAGAIQVARRDDTPTDTVIGGRPAAWIKEAVCRSTVWAVRRGASPTLKGGYRKTLVP